MRTLALVAAYAFAIPAAVLLLAALILMFPAWVIWGWAGEPAWMENL